MEYICCSCCQTLTLFMTTQINYFLKTLLIRFLHLIPDSDLPSIVTNVHHMQYACTKAAA